MRMFLMFVGEKPRSPGSSEDSRSEIASLVVLRQMVWTIVLFRTSTVVCGKIVHGRWSGLLTANDKLCAVHKNKGEV